MLSEHVEMTLSAERKAHRQALANIRTLMQDALPGNGHPGSAQPTA